LVDALELKLAEIRSKEFECDNRPGLDVGNYRAVERGGALEPAKGVQSADYQQRHLMNAAEKC